MSNSEEPVQIPITGELDLHTFAPGETALVVEAYLEACRARGIFEVRIIHGKGTGTLRKTVHSLLKRIPEVISFRLADPTSGGWGATSVVLKRISPLEAQAVLPAVPPPNSPR